MRKLLPLALLFPLLSLPASAAMPEEGTEAYELMLPFSSWFKAHGACCSIADGRPVSARIRNGIWEVFIRTGDFPKSNLSGWIAVPEDKVLREENPVGVPILWMSNNHIYCFIANSGG